MKVGVQFSEFEVPGGTRALGPALAKAARLAEDVGFDSIWVMDHFWQIGSPGVEREPMLEGWTTLGFLAAHTQSARLGLLVGGVDHRAPGLWVKSATTLDVLSGGRAWLGIGAGWNPEESEGLGFPFPEARDRLDMLEETLQIATQMWQGEQGTESSFSGKHYRATRLLNSPQSISRPRVPIMVGGSGEQRTLRLVARYADGTNIGLGNAADVHRKYRVLARHCEELGRPFEDIERSTRQGFTFAKADGSAIEWFEIFAAAGAQHIMLSASDAYDLAALERFGREVLPRIHGLVPADPRLAPPRSLGEPTGMGLPEWLRSWRPPAPG